MNKSNINVPLAGATVDSDSTAQNHSVSQPNANTNVVGSLFSQREIKFRAWDDGKMFYSHNNSINTSNFQNKWFFEKVREDAIIMQYTDLKDKNGKEIYEGDIISNRNADLRMVVFKDGCFQMVLLNGEKDVSGCIWFYEVAVIGNIFENRVLLQALR